MQSAVFQVPLRAAVDLSCWGSAVLSTAGLHCFHHKLVFGLWSLVTSINFLSLALASLTSHQNHNVRPPSEKHSLGGFFIIPESHWHLPSPWKCPEDACVDTTVCRFWLLGFHFPSSVWTHLPSEPRGISNLLGSLKIMKKSFLTDESIPLTAI